MNAPDAGPEAAAADGPTSPPAAQYCRRCGALLDAATGECAACRDAPAPLIPPTSAKDQRKGSVGFALGLYFMLLMTSLLGHLAGAGEVLTDVAVECADAVIVLVWAIASWRSVSQGLRTAPRVGALLAGLGLGVASFLMASAAVHALTSVLDLPEMHYVQPILDEGFGYGTVLLAICVQPAVIEEIAFRGVILGALEKALNTREAIIVSALLFMVLHLAVASFPHLFVMGLLLGILRTRTRSLYPCMVLHFTHNSLCVLEEALGWW